MTGKDYDNDPLSEDADADELKQVVDDKLAREIWDREEREDTIDQMSNFKGRRWIYRRMMTMFEVVLFTGNSKTYFNLGMEQARRALEQDLKLYCPVEYIMMLVENELDPSDQNKIRFTKE